MRSGVLGLVEVLRKEIVPRLLREAPQPSEADLEADPQAMRFTMVVDREAYSPVLFKELAVQRIAILTYRKHVDEVWPAEAFSPQSVRLHTGEEVEMHLAERVVCLSNGLEMREVRRSRADGTQGSIITTNRKLDLRRVAAAMGARWSQENFLKYMRTHFGLDRLIEYGTAPLPESTVVVNPAHRRLDQQVRRERALLSRLRAELGGHVLPPDPTHQQTQAFEVKGGALREKVQAQTEALNAAVQSRKAVPRKITLKELPESERFAQLRPESKHFIDTIKMLAYRAESVLAGEAREALKREDDARALMRRVFTTPANLRPDLQAKTLTVEIHRLASPLQDAAVKHLCEILSETETTFPTTDLRLIYRQVGSL